MIIGILDGRLEDVIAMGRGLVQAAGEAGAPGYTVRTRTLMIMPYIHLGLSRSTLDSESPFDTPLMIPYKAWLLAHAGDTAVARSLLDKWQAGLTKGQLAIEVPAMLVLAMLEAATMLEEREIAAKLASAVECLSSVTLVPHHLACPARYLAAASALLGDPVQAEAYYQQAASLCGKIRFRPEIALTRLGLAELLLEHYPSRRAEAIAHLDFAIEEFRAMKMAPSLELALKHKN